MVSPQGMDLTRMTPFLFQKPFAMRHSVVLNLFAVGELDGATESTGSWDYVDNPNCIFSHYKG